MSLSCIFLWNVWEQSAALVWKRYISSLHNIEFIEHVYLFVLC